MKKLFTLALVLAAGCTLSANAEYKYRLIEKADPWSSESSHYTYDEKGRVVTIDGEDDLGFFRTEYAYDEAGNLASEHLWQSFDVDENYEPSDWRKTGITYYKYDENGNIVERSNVFNEEAYLAGEKWSDQATYRNIYDAEGRIVTQTQHWGFELNKGIETPYQTVTYTYNDKGQLVLQYWSYDSPFYGNGWQKRTFEYNGLGQLVSFKDQWSDGASGSHEFSYNEDGDLVEHIKWNASKTIVDAKWEFTYTDKLSSETVYPIYPENFEAEDNFLNNKYQIETMNAYVRGDDDSTVLVNEWEYTYGEYAGIESVTMPAGSVMAAQVMGDVLKIRGLNDNTAVQIYGLDGRMVQSADAVNGNVNVRGLESGVYVVATPAGAVKFVR